MTEEQRRLRESLAEMAGNPADDGKYPPDKWSLLARAVEAVQLATQELEAQMDLLKERVRQLEGGE